MDAGDGFNENHFCAEEQTSDDGKGNSRPGPGAQNHLRPLPAKNMKCLPQVKEKLRVAFRMSDEIRSTVHIRRQNGLVVQHVKMHVFFVCRFQPAHFRQMAAAGGDNTYLHALTFPSCWKDWRRRRACVRPPPPRRSFAPSTAARSFPSGPDSGPAFR